MALLPKDRCLPLKSDADLTPLLEQIGDARIVMLGEASHGTHEYYTWRSHISKRLIEEKGFGFVAVEGDWPDCYRLNRFVKGYSNETSVAAVLAHFRRWPTWMWRNWEVAAFAEWLKSHNQSLPANRRAGFYGLDVYSLWESMEAIMDYLRKTDPDTLGLAEQAFRCFEPYGGEDGYNYASALRFVPRLCEQEVAQLLQEIQTRRPQYDHDMETAFSTEQNAHVAVNAEAYYRAMLNGGAASWNARDRHMQDTLERLLGFYGAEGKAVVWAHNTHIGDAAYTDMRNDGMYTIGQLSREKIGEEQVVLVGFGSYSGTVTAGKKWGAPMQAMDMPPAMPGSWEDLLYQSAGEDALLLMKDIADTPFGKKPIPQRAVGVVYQPAVERPGNYVSSLITKRYDAFLFISETRALHAMPADAVDRHEMPETYPFGV
ncbi:erythromycin esterase family protein [Sediminibacterium soli]|uniref:erythromycin esterase family protein n=1 Tax=Sediminibacterium soli TaxID=2698829 RepID=UPI00137AF534|nr:erythromycin esterase family protein [Sediminibacterium soli]NCI46763.1 erythromycin esterase family protein [Sediminibacterium soli]